MLSCLLCVVFKLRIVMCTLCLRSHWSRSSLVFGYGEGVATFAPEKPLYAVKSCLRNSRASPTLHFVFVAQMSCNLTGPSIPFDISSRKDCSARTSSRLRRRNSGNCEQLIMPYPCPAIQFFPLTGSVSHCATPWHAKILNFRGPHAIPTPALRSRNVSHCGVETQPCRPIATLPQQTPPINPFSVQPLVTLRHVAVLPAIHRALKCL
jgi:hypothetical protein